jgi:hypothetical protein
VKDTSRQGRWHNRRFAALAGELGLHVEADKRTGWSQTRLTDQLATRYAEQLAGLGAALLLWRHAERQTGPATGSRNLLACSCACGRKLRASRTTLEQAPILCGRCEQPFEPVERALTLSGQRPGPGERHGRDADAARCRGAAAPESRPQPGTPPARPTPTRPDTERQRPAREGGDER